MTEEKIIYRYDDNICFRKCSLSNNPSKYFGDCSKFYSKRTFSGFFEFTEKFYCSQHGFHFHCSKHQSIELEMTKEDNKCILKCPKCNNHIEIESYNELLRNCQKKFNILELKDAKCIRLDDWYMPETKERIDTETDYWISVEVKTDKDKDTMIVLYIGKKDSPEKVQYFIKPEKLQLSHDYKDLDPATILSKIEVTLKDRTIKQELENE